MPDTEQLQTIPVGPLAFIPMSSCTTLGKQVDHYLAKWRNERENEHTSTIHFNGYLKDSYIISAKTPRFGSGEAKGALNESIRGDDVLLILSMVTLTICLLMTIFKT